MKIVRKKLFAISFAAILCSTTFFSNPYSNHSIVNAAPNVTPTVSEPASTPIPPQGTQIPVVSPVPSDSSSYIPVTPPKESEYICNYPIGPQLPQTPIPDTFSPSPSPSSSGFGINGIQDGSWYYLRNGFYGGYLQVEDNLAEDGQNVIVGPYRGSAGSKWLLKSCYPDHSAFKEDFYLYNGLGDFVLGTAGNVTSEGNNIVIHSIEKQQEPVQFFIRPYGTMRPFQYEISAEGNYLESVDNPESTEVSNAVLNHFDTWVLEAADSPDVSTSPHIPSPTFPSYSPVIPSPSISPSPALPSVSPAPLISFTYNKISQWDTGFVSEIIVKNPSHKVYKDWTLTFHTDSSITSLWGAELVSQSGSTVTIKNPSWKRELEPGESVTIGFVAAGTNYKLSDCTFSCS